MAASREDVDPRPVGALAGGLGPEVGALPDASRDVASTVEPRPSPLEEHGPVGSLQSRLQAAEARAGLATELHGEGAERLAPGEGYATLGDADPPR